MAPIFTAAAIEFLQSFQADVRVRWSPDDLKAQAEFVNGRVSGRHWLDWSEPAAALQIIQSIQAQTAVGTVEKYDALVLAGAVVELLEPTSLFDRAALPLASGGELIGIIPCLRDNSPESQHFMEHASATLWPYYTAEELLEMLRESGWLIDQCATRFVAVPRFNEAVVKEQFGFKGFNRIFEQLMAEGYDPMEVGWGEMRFVAEQTESR